MAGSGERFVSYCRVSTDRQGRSGLGLAAQQAAVRDYVARVGGRLIAEHVEIESGKRNERPELSAALRACGWHRATLVIAKLDRLSRNLGFIVRLLESHSRFVACDMPEANELTVHILAAVAQAERKAISARTMAALDAAKARGTRLGFANPKRVEDAKECGDKSRAAALANSLAVRQRNARDRAMLLSTLIEDLRANGHTTLRALASELNTREIPAPRGGRWHPESVRVLLQHLGFPGREQAA